MSHLVNWRTIRNICRKIYGFYNTVRWAAAIWFCTCLEVETSRLLASSNIVWWLYGEGMWTKKHTMCNKRAYEEFLCIWKLQALLFRIFQQCYELQIYSEHADESINAKSSVISLPTFCVDDHIYRWLSPLHPAQWQLSRPLSSLTVLEGENQHWQSGWGDLPELRDVSWMSWTLLSDSWVRVLK